MWDVVWTDAKESRGERRQRKATKRTQGDNRPTTTANSMLSRSSTSSSDGYINPGFRMLKPTEKSKSPASLSPSISSRHSSPTARSFDFDNDRSSSSSISCEAIPATIDRSNKYSLHQGQRPKRSEESVNPSTGADKLNAVNSAYIHKAQQIPRIISLPWDDQAEDRVALEPCQFIQVLSEGSFIVRSTKITTTLRTPSDAIFGLNSTVTISANAGPRPRSSDTQLQVSMRTSGSRSPGRPPPILIAPRRVASSNDLLTPKSTKGWKPPSAWDCTPTRETFPPTVEHGPEEAERSETGTPCDLDEAQQEIKQLATESNTTRLIRLQGEWQAPIQPNLHKGCQPEGVQRMLSALANMYPEGVAMAGQSKPQDAVKDKTRRILAVHETPVIASYLAGINDSKQVYHLTSLPHSHILSPNIQQILVPGVTSSCFPVAPSFFEAAHSLRLPHLTTTPEIPGLLQNVHRCLEPGGALHLALIDPLPLASSLGPLLHSWIECHLLSNLEESFRCANPTRLLPIWLANASFHVESKSVELSAASVAEKPLDEAEIRYLDETAAEARLLGLVGWMLWVEVWGEYIIADRWWWEDASILEECRKLKTTWQWCLVKAYKNSLSAA